MVGEIHQMGVFIYDLIFRSYLIKRFIQFQIFIFFKLHMPIMNSTSFTVWHKTKTSKVLQRKKNLQVCYWAGQVQDTQTLTDPETINIYAPLSYHNYVL